jgi:hypothetical protein
MRTLTLAVLSGALASLALAQAHNPVPTRISVEEYGLAADYGMDLRLALQLDDPVTSKIEVFGGRPGKPAFLLIAVEPAAIPMPWGNTLLVAPNAVPVAGMFDERGVFAVPIDVALVEYVGATVYFQGAELDIDSPVPVTMSYGLAITFVAGNEQPALSYAGPPQTVVLCKTEGTRHTFGLLTQVLAPRLGYTLAEVSRQTDSDCTRVFLKLVEPAAASGWKLDNKRLYLALGEEVAPKIEVWIQVERPDDPVPPFFGLAAMVQRIF